VQVGQVDPHQLFYFVFDDHYIRHELGLVKREKVQLANLAWLKFGHRLEHPSPDRFIRHNAKTHQTFPRPESLRQGVRTESRCRAGNAILIQYHGLSTTRPHEGLAIAVLLQTLYLDQSLWRCQQSHPNHRAGQAENRRHPHSRCPDFFHRVYLHIYSLTRRANALWP